MSVAFFGMTFVHTILLGSFYIANARNRLDQTYLENIFMFR